MSVCMLHCDVRLDTYLICDECCMDLLKLLELVVTQ